LDNIVKRKSIQFMLKRVLQDSWDVVGNTESP